MGSNISYLSPRSGADPASNPGTKSWDIEIGGYDHFWYTSRGPLGNIRFSTGNHQKEHTFFTAWEHYLRLGAKYNESSIWEYLSHFCRTMWSIFPDRKVALLSDYCGIWALQGAYGARIHFLAKIGNIWIRLGAVCVYVVFQVTLPPGHFRSFPQKWPKMSGGEGVTWNTTYATVRSSKNWLQITDISSKSPQYFFDVFAIFFLF